MIEVRDGGRRRIDRVLAPGFAENLGELSLGELRARRDEADQEETDLSYLRRLLHGRMDIVRAEQTRRRSGTGEPVVSELAHILATNALGPAAGAGRHQSTTPSRAEAHRRHVEALVADVDLSNVTALTDEQLDAAHHAYESEERSVSQRRREVQHVVDRLNSEIGARYAAGRASVDELLADHSGTTSG